MLANAACAAERLVGAAVAYQPLLNEPVYAELLASEFTYVTPENATKWSALQPNNPNEWDFTEADAIIEAAIAQQQRIKGHTLVWHNQLPAFVNDMSAQELKRALRKHIERTVKHFRGKVDSWDVVNEAIADDGTLRNSVFLEKLGESYIGEAFREARKHDKQAKLYYNDYGIATINAKSDGVYSLVASLVDKRVPIDGVGFQMHIDARFAPTKQQILDNFARFADLGLSINISELDVRIAELAGSQAEKRAIQQQIYHTVVSACVETPACDAVTTWGFTDRHSWIDSTFGPDDPLQFDENYQKKPAYYGMVDGFVGLEPDAAGAAPNLVYSGSFETDAGGWFGFGIAGVGLSDVAHTGHQSGLATGRTDTWQGPAFNLNSLVSPAWEYDASLFVRLNGAASDAARLTLKTRCRGESDQFTNVASGTATDGGWTELSGTLMVPDCELEEVTLYVEGPAAGVDVLVDDAQLRPRAEPLGPNVVSNGEFEADTSGWFGFGPATITHSTAQAFAGTGSALVTTRSANWQGPATNLLPVATIGATYRLGAFVKLANAASAPINLTVKSVCDGTESFTQVASNTANDLNWVELTGSYQVPPCTNLTELTMYLEGAPAGVDFYIDNVSAEQRLSIPVAEPPAAYNVVGNGGVELGTSDWAGQGIGFNQTSAFVHSGSFAGVGSGRTAAWQGPGVNLPGGEASYALSIFALQNSTETIILRMSAKLTCGGSDSFHFVGQTSAAPATWVPISGNLNIPAGCERALVYIEQGDGTTFPDIYVDDFVGTPTSIVNLAGNAGVEVGTSNWQGFGAGFAQTSAFVHSGSFAGVASGRTDSWQGGSYFMATGAGSYSVSLFALHTASESINLLLSAKLVCNGVESFPTLASATVAGETWVELAGTLNVPVGCTTVQPYVQQSGGSVFPDIYMDDITVLLAD